MATLNVTGGALSPTPTGIDVLADKSEQPQYTNILKACFIFVIMVSTVIGNAISMVVILKVKTLRNPSGHFMISLAAADFIVGALVVPFSFSAAVQGKWTFSDTVCRWIGFFNFYSTTLSISNLVALTIDRWICVTRPLQYGRWMTHKTSYIIIGLIWIGVFVIDIPMTISSVGDFYYMENIYVCSPKWDSNYAYTCVLIGIYILPSLTTVIVLNLRLFCISRSHVKKMALIQKQTHAPCSNSTVKSKCVILAIVITFQVSWLPFFIIEVLKLLKLVKVHHNVTFTANWIAISNSFMNSIIYTCLNRKFRMGIKRLFKKSRRRDRKTRDNVV